MNSPARGCAGQVEVDSSAPGTGTWAGRWILARERNWPPTGTTGRRIAPGSSTGPGSVDYDLVVAMDRRNLADLRRMAPDRATARDGCRLLRSLTRRRPGRRRGRRRKGGNPYDGDVPDPYNGSAADYALAFDLVQAAASGLAAQLAALIGDGAGPGGRERSGAADTGVAARLGRLPLVLRCARFTASAGSTSGAATGLCWLTGGSRSPSSVAAGRLRAGLDGVFEAEARGLRWLAAEAGAVPVPDVLGRDASAIAVSWLPGEGASAAAAEGFGRDLARLHLAGGASARPGRVDVARPAAGQRRRELGGQQRRGRSLVAAVVRTRTAVPMRAAGWLRERWTRPTSS